MVRVCPSKTKRKRPSWCRKDILSFDSILLLVKGTVMIMAIAKGIDDAIANLLDKKMMANIIAAESMMGRNEFCTNYLKAYRSKQLEM